MDVQISSRQPYVFVSYASADRERVLEIVAALREAGISCWIDDYDIEGGANWAGRIAEAIEGCSALLLLSSAASLTSRNVGSELGLAWRGAKPIIPLLLDATPAPTEVRYFLELSQWIEVLDHLVETWLPKVEQALARLGILPAIHPPAELTDPSAAAAPSLASSVPLPLTPTIGREDAIHAITDRLRSARLLTLLGPGGTGKTRLAQEVALRVQHDFPDGIVWVDLAPISDPALVIPTVAAALGVSDAGARSLSETLGRAVGARQMLLVLDNMEQVVDAAADLSQLLAACAHLHLLVTSRVALRLSAEQVYVVAPLAVPEPDAAPERLRDNEAVALFVQRATAARPTFALTTETAVTVAAICRRLDGLPLALELAASRIRIMTPQALLERLEHPLDLLSGGARDLPERQQTLRRTLQWSHDLLTPAQQRLFRRVSVFVGGWTLVAAEAVVNTEGDLGIDVLDGLLSLVEQSLIRVQDDAEETTRFTMLGTIREFARECLDASEDSAAMGERHARHFLALARRAEQHLDAGTSSSPMRDLLPERDNLRAMLAWGLAHEAALTLVGAAALQWYWLSTGQMREGFQWLERALIACHDAPLSLRANALTAAGALAGWLGAVETSLDLGEQGLVSYRQADDQRGVATALFNLARSHQFAGNLAQARAMNEESLSLYRTLGDVNGVVGVTGNLGIVLGLLGDHAAAIRLMEQALAMARQHDNDVGTVIWLTDLGQAEALHGDPARARAYLGESLLRNRKQGDPRFVALCFEALASLGHDGNGTHAARLLGAAAGLRAQIAYPVLAAEQQEYDQIVARVRGQLDAQQYDAAWHDGYAMALDDAIAFALRVLHG
jgi:predicted ATPase